MRRNAVVIVGPAGRTCTGGLTKFRPMEPERIPIPKLGRLHGRKKRWAIATRRIEVDTMVVDPMREIDSIRAGHYGDSRHSRRVFQ